MQLRLALSSSHSVLTDRQTDRQAGRQAGRQTDRQTGRQTDRLTEGRSVTNMHTYKQTDRHGYRQPCRQKYAYIQFARLLDRNNRMFL